MTGKFFTFLLRTLLLSGIFSPFLFAAPTASKITAVQTFISDGELYYNRQRQGVYIAFITPGKPQRVWIGVNTGAEDMSDSNNKQWTIAEETDRDAYIVKNSDQQLDIFMKGKTLFSSKGSNYNYIGFIGLCGDAGQPQKLLFEMLVGGTANGDIHDILFIYYDDAEKAVKHDIIESLYLQTPCDLDGALENRRQASGTRATLQQIFEQLRPSENTTDLIPAKHQSLQLPTKILDSVTLMKLLAELQKLKKTLHGQPDPSDNDNEIYEDDNYGVVIEPIGENSRWKVIQLSYLELWESWGVLLAKDKHRDQWISFYNIPQGGSKVMLYLDDELSLQGDQLEGRFCPLCGGLGQWGEYVISLEGFTITALP